jgi:hypothetical protein
MLSNVLSLIFSRAIYKRNTNGYSWFVRQNGCLLPFIVFVIMFTLAVGVHICNFVLYLLLLFTLYKFMGSFYRYLKNTIPIYQDNQFKPRYDTPFFKLNVVLWLISIVPFAPIVAREKLNNNDLRLHRRQQFARCLFYMSMAIVVSLFVFK